MTTENIKTIAYAVLCIKNGKTGQLLSGKVGVANMNFLCNILASS